MSRIELKLKNPIGVRELFQKRSEIDPPVTKLNDRPIQDSEHVHPDMLQPCLDKIGCPVVSIDGKVWREMVQDPSSEPDPQCPIQCGVDGKCKRCKKAFPRVIRRAPAGFSCTKHGTEPSYIAEIRFEEDAKGNLYSISMMRCASCAYYGTSDCDWVLGETIWRNGNLVIPSGADSLSEIAGASAQGNKSRKRGVSQSASDAADDTETKRQKKVKVEKAGSPMKVVIRRPSNNSGSGSVPSGNTLDLDDDLETDVDLTHQTPTPEARPDATGHPITSALGSKKPAAPPHFSPNSDLLPRHTRSGRHTPKVVADLEDDEQEEGPKNQVSDTSGSSSEDEDDDEYKADEEEEEGTGKSGRGRKGKGKVEAGRGRKGKGKAEAARQRKPEAGKANLVINTKKVKNSKEAGGGKAGKVAEEKKAAAPTGEIDTDRTESIATASDQNLVFPAISEREHILGQITSSAKIVPPAYRSPEASSAFNLGGPLSRADEEAKFQQVHDSTSAALAQSAHRLDELSRLSRSYLGRLREEEDKNAHLAQKVSEMEKEVLGLKRSKADTNLASVHAKEKANLEAELAKARTDADDWKAKHDDLQKKVDEKEASILKLKDKMGNVRKAFTDMDTGYRKTNTATRQLMAAYDQWNIPMGEKVTACQTKWKAENLPTKPTWLGLEYESDNERGLPTPEQLKELFDIDEK